MESIVLGTMAYTGNKINKKKEKAKSAKNKKSYKKSCDLYNTNIADTIHENTRKQAEKVKESGYAQQFDTIMVDNLDHVPVGVNQSYNKINGFDMSLQRDLDFTNGYSEFSKTEMHYDVVPKKELMTSNMNPHTKKRDYVVGKDYSHVLGLHTGNDDLYMSKENFTPVTLFEPMKNLTYVNGAPVFTEYLEERYVPSYKNNNGNLPFKNKLKVAPGLNDQEQKALRGNAVYRILPKTTTEIRGITDPKITYEARMNESGKKGHKPSVEFNLTKQKRAIHKTRKEEQPNYSRVEKPIRPGKFKNPNTNRSVSRDEFGHLHNPQEGHKQDGEYETPFKITYHDDSISRSVSNIHNKPVLQNSGSYSNNENERSSTNHNIHGTASNINEGSYSIDRKDIPLTTLRQLMIDGDTNIGVTQNNDASTYVFSNDMILPINNRITTGPLTKEGNINPTEKFTNLNPTDKSKMTIRETTSNNTVEGTIAPETYNTYSTFNDKAKQTIGETTSNFKTEGFVNPEYKYGNLINTDKAKVTIKQTTGPMTVEGPIIPEYYAMNLNHPDKARITVGETTSSMIKEGFMNPDYHAINLNNPDKARITVGETTSSMVKEGFMNPDYYATNLNNPDMARTTVGETTSSMVKEGFMNPDYHALNLNPTDKAKTTVGETTTSFTVEGSLNPEHKETHHYNPLDVTKQTIKETTSLSKYISNTLRSDGGINYVRNNDKAKPTIKQTTLSSVDQANIGSSHHTSIIRSNDNVAKATVKQTTLYSTGENNVNRGTITYSKDYKDLPKQTVKQTTLYQQRGTVGQETKGYTRDEKDKTRSTLRQTTENNKFTGPLKNRQSYARSQQAERNICIDDRREILTYNRPAGPKSDKMGPIINKKQVKLKEERILNRPQIGFKECNTDKLINTYTRNKNNLNSADYALNTVFTNTFKDNPLANALMHQKN